MCGVVCVLYRRLEDPVKMERDWVCAVHCTGRLEELVELEWGLCWCPRVCVGAEAACVVLHTCLREGDAANRFRWRTLWGRLRRCGGPAGGIAGVEYILQWSRNLKALKASASVEE